MKFFWEWWTEDDGTDLPETLMTLFRTQAEIWTFLEQIGNTIHSAWETTALSTLPVWWAQRQAAVEPSATEHNVSIMVLYWFLFSNKWEIILVIHQQQPVIKGLIITEKVSIMRSQEWAATNAPVKPETRGGTEVALESGCNQGHLQIWLDC